jgi:putative transposase
MMRQAVHSAVESAPGLSARWACRALGLTRSGYYRWRNPGVQRKEDPAQKQQRAAVRRVCGKWIRYGARRVCAQLRREGMRIGKKRVRRLMREEGLVVKPRKRFVRTTNSDHGLRVYPNLARGLELTGINQLWVADLTYVHLGEGFIYVAVILDAFSRRAIGWAICRSLEDSLSIAALRMALRRRGAPEGLVHHSDRGSQYASGDYTTLLKSRGIAISMSRRANPYDNAKAESFMKTFKCDEVHLRDYADEADARKRIHTFLARIYNEQRLHSALGYVPPAEFEKTLGKPSSKKKEDPSATTGLDPKSTGVRQQASTGETQTGSAGMQPARDSRPGPSRRTRGAAQRGDSPSPNPHSNGFPMPKKIQPQEARNTASGYQ